MLWTRIKSWICFRTLQNIMEKMYLLAGNTSIKSETVLFYEVGEKDRLSQSKPLESVSMHTFHDSIRKQVFRLQIWWHRIQNQWWRSDNQVFMCPAKTSLNLKIKRNKTKQNKKEEKNPNQLYFAKEKIWMLLKSISPLLLQGQETQLSHSFSRGSRAVSKANKKAPQHQNSTLGCSLTFCFVFLPMELAEGCPEYC